MVHPVRYALLACRSGERATVFKYNLDIGIQIVVAVSGDRACVAALGHERPAEPTLETCKP